MRTLTLILISFVCCAALTTAAEPKLHLLLAVDAAANPSGHADAAQLTNTFAKHVPDAVLSIANIPTNSPKALQAGIIDYGKNIDASDTVVFYYNGIAGKNPGDGKPIFIFGNNAVLPKQTALDLLVRSNARLAVMISESRLARRQERPLIVNEQKPSRAKQVSPLFQMLFFDAAGTIDISSSANGESASAFAKQKVSIFTYAFCQVLDKMSERENEQWESVFRQTRRAAVQLTADDGAKPFTPQMNIASQKIIFGAGVQDTGTGNGVKVGRVKPNSVADKNGLEAGDIILAIDDKPIRNEKDYIDAIDNAGVSITITILNVRTNKPERYRFRLRFDILIGCRVQIREDKSGVTVVDLVPGYPAQKSGLEIGDVILSIDGKPLTSDVDYGIAVDNASDVIQMKVRDVRSGNVRDVQIPLTP